MSEWGSMSLRDAVVTLANGDVLPGNIHLLGAVAYRVGPETPLEMLNRPDAFFPLTFDDGGVFLLSKATVAMVVCDSDGTDPQTPSPDEEDEMAEAPGHVLALELVLTTGEELQGEALSGLETTRPRHLDYLNSVSPFFELRTVGGMRLINRSHVRLVRPLD